MKKLSFIVAILMFASCSTSPIRKANALIEEKIKKNLTKPNSYESVDTQLDSTFTPLDDSKFHEQLMKLYKAGLQIDVYDNKIKDIKYKMNNVKSSMAIWSKPWSEYSKNQYQQAKEEYETYQKEFKQYTNEKESVTEKVQKQVEQIKTYLLSIKEPEFIGYKATHRYRANNNAGKTLIGDNFFVFDKNLTKIILSYDMESEEYITIQQLIKFIKEGSEDTNLIENN